MLQDSRGKGQGLGLAARFVFAGVLATALISPPAQGQVTGYLRGAPIAYSVPPPPSNPAVVELDLVDVRALHPEAGTAGEDEAIADAKAYDAPVLVPRFSDAARLPLSPQGRPVLVYLVSRALQDAAGYAQGAKDKYSRPRPYVEDAGIVPCNTAFLKPQESYPSGHAMNGYVAALLLADVIPQRRQQLLARGMRYGNNRIACGVHHPSDVMGGRLLAIAYVAALERNGEFQRDLACARKEQEIAAGGAGPLPPGCAALHL